MQTKATTVEDYLDTLPEDRRSTSDELRRVILKNLDKDYEEGIEYGMIGYRIPLTVYPKGYNSNPKQPLMIVAIASQKNYISLYMGGTYCGCGEHLDEDTPDMTWFKKEWAKTGKKLSIGKACIRFKKIDELALDVIGEAVRRVPAKVS